MEKYKVVLVIGNGFDLNIGLKTSYSDFMNSDCVKKYMKEHTNYLMKYLSDKNKLGWVDIENELSNYSKEIFTHQSKSSPEAKIIRERFRGEYINLCNVLKEYLTIEFKNFTKTDDTDAFRILKEICSYKSYFILNFNYTDSIGRMINSASHESVCNIYDIVRHIHGSLKNDIVFGVEDSGGINNEHVFLYKSHSKNQNIHGLPTIFDDTEKIVFFGYSLGKTDHSYFDDFFKKQCEKGCNYKELTFYHYDTNAYDNLIVQLNKLTDNRLSKLKQYNMVTFKTVSDNLSF